jgi:hypothetical protein
MKRSKTPLIVGVLALGVAGFLLFRPDKLFADDPVDESLTDAFGTTTVTSPATTGESTSTSTTAQTQASTTTEATAPVALAMGMFTGIGHQAMGTATVYEEGGRHVLRFEDDTDIQNGPDLYVWLLPDDGYEGGTPVEYLDLGKLKGNVGGQNYELPANFDPDVHRAVLIWCLRFTVPFAVAPLTP